MQQTINERVMLLKKELGLTDIEFCGRASISTSTLNKLRKTENVTLKVYNSIITAFNVNREWLLEGKGSKIFAAAEKELSINSWKEEAYFTIKEENTLLKKELERMWQMVQHLTGGAKPNFLNAVEYARLTMLLPGKSFNGVRAMS